MGEPQSQTHQSVMTLMDTFLKEAELSEKAATNLDLAGDAKSTHPSANVDDKTKPAQEGARSAENEADVRKDVPDTINDESSKNTGGTEGATVNGDQGTVTMASDSGLKGNVDTPKKDHSQSMSDSGPGDGSESFKGDWDKASAASKLMGEANGLLADLATTLKEAGEEMPAANAGKAAPAAVAAPAAPQPAGGGEDKSSSEVVELYKKAADQYPEDVEAGYVAAALLAQQLGLVKDASTDADAAAVEAIRKEAAADAESYVEFLKGFAEATQKSAQPLGGMEEEMGGGDPAALAALANSGEGEAGGMGEGGEMGGEEAGLEGLVGAAGGEGGVGGEEGGEEAIIEALAEALDEAGVSPEDLAQAVAEAQGGGELGAEGGELGAEGGEMGAEGGALGGALGGGGAGLEAGMQEGVKPASATKPAIKKAAGKGSNRAALKAAVAKQLQR